MIFIFDLMCNELFLIQNYEQNKSLAFWVDTQRVQYRQREQGRKSSITNERIDLLNDIGFNWRLPHYNRAKGDQHFTQLLQFKKEVCVFALSIFYISLMNLLSCLLVLLVQFC